MKLGIVLLSIFLQLIIINITYGNEVIFCQIEIIRPTLKGSPKPLIITFTRQLHHEEIPWVVKKRYWPMKFEITAVDKDGKEYTIEHDAAWVEYYDAFPTLDEKGCVIVRRRESPEDSHLLEMWIESCNGFLKIHNLKGEKIFWSKDGNYLVTVSMPSPFYKKELGVYFYELYTGKSPGYMLKEIKFTSPKELQDYIEKNLIPSEEDNKKDFKLTVIQKR